MIFQKTSNVKLALGAPWTPNNNMLLGVQLASTEGFRDELQGLKSMNPSKQWWSSQTNF